MTLSLNKVSEGTNCLNICATRDFMYH